MPVQAPRPQIMPMQPNPAEAYVQQLFQMLIQKKERERQEELARKQREQRYDWQQARIKQQQDFTVKQNKIKADVTLGAAKIRADKDKEKAKLTVEHRKDVLAQGQQRINISKAKKPTTIVGALLDKLPPNATSGAVLKIHKQLKKDPSLNEIKLTQLALKGDKDSAAILEAMLERRTLVAEAQGAAMVSAKIGSVVDVDGVAQAIIQGRELMSNVKNTFGVAVQEAVRKAVLALDPKFDFLTPKIKHDAIKSVHTKLQQQRAFMGSFVDNLKKQVDRVGFIMKDIVSRTELRMINLPKRELLTRLKGSGAEKIVEAYLLEISNEIGKLSTGSAQSIRELSTEAQERWATIHDPNLSFKELKIILDETSHMADLRMESVEERININLGYLKDLTKKDIPGLTKTKTRKRFTIKSVR